MNKHCKNASEKVSYCLTLHCYCYKIKTLKNQTEAGPQLKE